MFQWSMVMIWLFNVLTFVKYSAVRRFNTAKDNSALEDYMSVGSRCTFWRWPVNIKLNPGGRDKIGGQRQK